MSEQKLNNHDGGYISEYYLKEIIKTQYNDLFSKLLKKSHKELFSLLKQQIILHLRIIDKQCDLSLLSKLYENYYEILKEDKCKIQRIYQKIKIFQEKDLTYINTLDIYVHCHKCKEAIHKCGNKLIIFDNLLFCLKCQKVYNQNHIKLFCYGCNKTFITTKRNLSEKKHGYFYSISYSKYHCFLENEEKIKCLKCGDDLYYNINNNKLNVKDFKEIKGIKDIFCIKCKLIFDTKKIFFSCKICGENFKAEPQIFRNFPSIKKYLLLLVHTFRKNVYILPDIITNKKCNCDLNGVQYFLHKDNGRLYEGNKNGKSVIICDHCYGIFKIENFNWNCPFCGGNFKAIKKNKNNIFEKNKRKNNLNMNENFLCISNEIKNIKEKLELNKNIVNHSFYNTIGFSNEKFNNCSSNYESSIQLTRDLSLSINERKSINLKDSQEIKNNEDLYKNNKGFINKENLVLFFKNNIRNELYNSQKLNPYYYFPLQNNSLRNRENNSIKDKKNDININNSSNNNSCNKDENKRSISYLNRNYNLNKDINNLNFSLDNNDYGKNRVISSYKKVMKKNSESLFNIKESLKEESLEFSSSTKKNFYKKKQNTLNKNNNILKKKINNSNHNNINININNNNAIRLKFNPNYKIGVNIIKNKNKNISPEMNKSNNSFSKKIIKTENNENTIKINISKEITLNGQKLKMSDINNKPKKKNTTINKKDIIRGNKKLVKLDNKNNQNKKQVNNNELMSYNINENKIIKKMPIKMIKSEKKSDMMLKMKLIDVDDKEQENSQIKKLKINFKKNNDNKLNNPNNIKLKSIQNPNVYLITNFNSTNKDIKPKENELNIIPEDTNNFVYVIPKNYKNKNIKEDIMEDEAKIKPNNFIYISKNNKLNINNITPVNNLSDNGPIEIKKGNIIQIKNNNIISNNKNNNFKEKDSICENNYNKRNIKKINTFNKINNNTNVSEIIKDKNILYNSNEKNENIHHTINDNNDFYILKNNKENNNINNENNIQVNQNKIENIKIIYNMNNSCNKNDGKDINKITNINESSKNETINQNIKNNLINIINIPELKIYFSSIESDKSKNNCRKSSFDIRESKNHFNILANSDNFEIKTIDSNYYSILRQIGKGAYGKIYLVEDPKTKVQFALKKIIIGDARELKENQEEFNLTWKLTKLNPELKIVKKFGIEIKKLDKYNLVMYVLMEAANCDWDQELINRKKDNAFYKEIELIEILKSLVNTLAELQKKGISHRDIKPQNILCFGRDGYKLSDFGEAKTKKKNYIKNNNFDDNTRKQTVRGTELYMSPILFKALQLNSIGLAQYNAYKSDVFSLGMCFLLASSLNYQSLFEIREIYDMEIIRKIVEKYLGKIYSQNYINLIINMLQIDEKLRPDFIELNSMIV